MDTIIIISNESYEITFEECLPTIVEEDIIYIETENSFKNINKIILDDILTLYELDDIY